MPAEVPRGWESRRVGDVLRLDRSMIRIAPDAEYTSVGVRSFGKGLFHYPPTRGSELGKLRYFRVKPGSLFISNIKAWEGAVAVTSEADHGCVASNRFLPYFGSPDAVHPAFLQYYFTLGPGLELLERASPGSADRNRTLGIAQFESLALPLPPLPEQKKIAAILYSVDEAIQATQAVIDQTRRVKAGLLQTLLTRGLPGHTRFKQTEIGEIPESWEVTTLERVLADVVPGKSLLTEAVPASPTEWGVLKVSAIGRDEFLAHENKRLPDRFLVRDEHRVRGGDVLISRANTANLVGACCRVPCGDYRLMLCDKTLRLVPNSLLITPDFLAESVCQPRARSYFAQVATGSSASMKNLSQSKITAFRLPLPSIAEQHDISARLGAVAEGMDHESKVLSGLLALKGGLLQDLLTGRVRVSP